MTFMKGLVSFVIPGLQWVALAALVVGVPVLLFFGFVVLSCSGRDPF